MNYELNDPTEIHFIELKKFVKTKPEELKNLFEKWLNFIKYGEEYKEIGHLPEELEKEKDIVMAMETYKVLTADEKFRYMAMDIEKARMDRGSEIANAREEGHALGIKEGIFEGKLETAHSMLKKGLSVSLITEITGLTEEEILHS